MIVTRSWLDEWIDLSGIGTDELCKTFNAIGLEVDAVESYCVPEKIVVGKVLKCERHPDADKLSVCQVDIGSGMRQIVCGAANVREGLSVAVAMIGAVMPGGLVIKPVKLRGVDSEGMICSSTEIGLPALGDGIMELDGSVGDLTPGTPLSKNSYFNDDVIEIELTANRGDCLSMRGVARDLSAAFNRPLNEVGYDDEEERRVGIGRILQLSHTESEHVNLRYRAVDLKELSIPLLHTLRLAQIGETKMADIDALLFYAMYSTGVIMRVYDHGFFTAKGEEKARVTLKQDDNGYMAVYGCEKASVVGIIQEKASCVTRDEGTLLIEASYIPPDIISKKMAEQKIENGPLFYRTSRGSEPQLDIGLKYCLGLFEAHSNSSVYGGSIEVCDSYEELVVGITMDEITSIIGMEVDKTAITRILKNLGFNIGKSQGKSFVISVPRFRHDIANKQDIVEEIVRLVGIDNIKARAFVFAEENRLEDDYATFKKRRTYRHRAAQSGFFESVHFIFNERQQLEGHGFVCVEPQYELLNPIVNTMDTLRPTLMLGLLNAASQNVKVGQKQVALFEVGSVFSPQRDESTKMTMLFAGDARRDGIGNGGKPESIAFDTFVQKISDIIGDFSLKAAEAPHGLAHPYQSAGIFIDGVRAGELFRLHPKVQQSFDLGATYLCELDFDALPYGLRQAEAFSKFQASFRDLSLLIPADMPYASIEEVIMQNKNREVVRFYPVDRYTDAGLGESVSLTLRFVLQSLEKTLEEDDITSAVSGILTALESELGLVLR